MKRSWNGFEQCRIGITSNPVAARARHEGADLAWSLLEGDDLYVRIQEALFSPEFGIPQTTWKGSSDTMPQEVLDEIWRCFQNNWDKGRMLLHALDINERNPIWQIPLHIREKQMLRYMRWAKRCNISACKQITICQSPHACQGALDPNVVLT